MSEEPDEYLNEFLHGKPRESPFYLESVGLGNFGNLFDIGENVAVQSFDLPAPAEEKGKEKEREMSLDLDIDGIIEGRDMLYGGEDFMFEEPAHAEHADPMARTRPPLRLPGRNEVQFAVNIKGQPVQLFLQNLTDYAFHWSDPPRDMALLAGYGFSVRKTYSIQGKDAELHGVVVQFVHNATKDPRNDELAGAGKPVTHLLWRVCGRQTRVRMQSVTYDQQVIIRSRFSREERNGIAFTGQSGGAQVVLYKKVSGKLMFPVNRAFMSAKQTDDLSNETFDMAITSREESEAELPKFAKAVNYSDAGKLMRKLLARSITDETETAVPAFAMILQCQKNGRRRLYYGGRPVFIGTDGRTGAGEFHFENARLMAVAAHKGAWEYAPSVAETIFPGRAYAFRLIMGSSGFNGNVFTDEGWFSMDGNTVAADVARLQASGSASGIPAALVNHPQTRDIVSITVRKDPVARKAPFVRIKYTRSSATSGDSIVSDDFGFSTTMRRAMFLEINMNLPDEFEMGGYIWRRDHDPQWVNPNRQFDTFPVTLYRAEGDARVIQFCSKFFYIGPQMMRGGRTVRLDYDRYQSNTADGRYAFRDEEDARVVHMPADMNADSALVYVDQMNILGDPSEKTRRKPDRSERMFAYFGRNDPATFLSLVRVGNARDARSGSPAVVQQVSFGQRFSAPLRVSYFTNAEPALHAVFEGASVAVHPREVAAQLEEDKTNAKRVLRAIQDGFDAIEGIRALRVFDSAADFYVPRTALAGLSAAGNLRTHSKEMDGFLVREFIEAAAAAFRDAKSKVDAGYDETQLARVYTRVSGVLHDLRAMKAFLSEHVNGIARIDEAAEADREITDAMKGLARRVAVMYQRGSFGPNARQYPQDVWAELTRLKRDLAAFGEEYQAVRRVFERDYVDDYRVALGLATGDRVSFAARVSAMETRLAELWKTFPALPSKLQNEDFLLNRIRSITLQPQRTAIVLFNMDVSFQLPSKQEYARMSVVGDSPSIFHGPTNALVYGFHIAPGEGGAAYSYKPSLATAHSDFPDGRVPLEAGRRIVVRVTPVGRGRGHGGHQWTIVLTRDDVVRGRIYRIDLDDTREGYEGITHKIFIVAPTVRSAIVSDSYDLRELAVLFDSEKFLRESDSMHP